MGITHATAATGTDSGDGKISKNAWNEDHVISGADLLASARYVRSSGNYSTNSTSWVDVDATNLALTITTGARRVQIGFVGKVDSNQQYSEVMFDVLVDGTSVSSGYGFSSFQAFTGGATGSVGFTWMTDVLSAGSHTFKLRWKISYGTGTSILYGSSTAAAHFWVQEMPDSAVLGGGGGGLDAASKVYAYNAWR